MKILDLKGELAVARSLASAARTASANGVSLDLQGYNGQLMAILESAAGTGTTPTLDVKVQDSADDTAFADVSGLTFTQVTTAASLQTLRIDSRAVRRYIRLVATIGGSTPSFNCAGLFVGQKQTI